MRRDPVAVFMYVYTMHDIKETSEKLYRKLFNHKRTLDVLNVDFAQ